MSDPGAGGPGQPGGWYPSQPTPSEPAPPPPPPSGYNQPAYGQPSQPAYGQPAKTEGSATAALICGIVGLFLFGIILGIVALVLANTANKRIEESGGTLGGKGMVTAARVLGVIDIILAVLVIAFIFNA